MLFPVLLPAPRQALADPSLLEVLSDQGIQRHQEHRGHQGSPSPPETDEKEEGSQKDAFPSPGPEHFSPISGNCEETLTYLHTWRTSWPRGALNPNSWLTL